jgi:hypothetical protein
MGNIFVPKQVPASIKHFKVDKSGRPLFCIVCDDDFISILMPSIIFKMLQFKKTSKYSSKSFFTKKIWNYTSKPQCTNMMVNSKFKVNNEIRGDDKAKKKFI